MFEQWCIERRKKPINGAWEDWEDAVRLETEKTFSEYTYDDYHNLEYLVTYQYRIRTWDGTVSTGWFASNEVLFEYEPRVNTFEGDTLRRIVDDQEYLADTLRRIGDDQEYEADTRRIVVSEDEYSGDTLRRIIGDQEYEGDTKRRIGKEQSYEGDTLRLIREYTVIKGIPDTIRIKRVDPRRKKVDPKGKKIT